MNYLYILLAVLVPVLAFGIGGILSSVLQGWLRRHGSVVMAFAAGAMLALTFGHILPETIAHGSIDLLWWVLGGIVAFYVVEHLLCRDCCDLDHDDTHHPTGHRHAGQMTAIGLGVHSVFDGVIVVLAAMADLYAGFLIAGALALHRLPNGAILGSLLTIDETKRKALWIVFAASTPLLGLLLIPMHDIAEPYLNMGKALSAGALLYVALAELLPRTHAHFRWQHLVWLGLGILMIIGLEMLGDPHGHHHDDHGHGHEAHADHDDHGHEEHEHGSHSAEEHAHTDDEHDHE